MVSNASPVRVVLIRSVTCRKNRPGGESANGMPALSSGTMSHKSRAAATCRVKFRSGVMRAAVTPSSAAWRILRAIASASARGEGASTSVRPCVAGPRSPNFGPSDSHWSVTGAGRSDKETNLLRAGFGEGWPPHSLISSGCNAIADISLRNRNWGWSSATPLSPSSASQTCCGISKSKPGSTIAPCGKAATARINSPVAPRDPVDPATIIGCAGGVISQVAIKASMTWRWRASLSGSVFLPVKNFAIILRNCSDRSQCPD